MDSAVAGRPISPPMTEVVAGATSTAVIGIGPTLKLTGLIPEEGIGTTVNCGVDEATGADIALAVVVGAGDFDIDMARPIDPNEAEPDISPIVAIVSGTM